MINKINKNINRKVRAKRIRTNLIGTPERPRLNVFRSLNQIYAQIIDDTNGVTLVSASSLNKTLDKKLAGKTKREKAFIVGEEIAKKAIKKGISTVVFDRAGYIYAGRVKALADGARESGLNF